MEVRYYSAGPLSVLAGISLMCGVRRLHSLNIYNPTTTSIWLLFGSDRLYYTIFLSRWTLLWDYSCSEIHFSKHFKDFSCPESETESSFLTWKMKTVSISIILGNVWTTSHQWEEIIWGSCRIWHQIVIHPFITEDSISYVLLYLYNFQIWVKTHLLNQLNWEWNQSQACAAQSGWLNQRPPQTIQSQYCITMFGPTNNNGTYFFGFSNFCSSISSTLLHISFDYIRRVKSWSKISQHWNQLCT